MVIRSAARREASSPRAPEKVLGLRSPEKDKSSIASLPGFRPSHFLVHYDEIALKGGNRERFERLLAANLKRALEGAGPHRVQRLFGRLVVELDKGASAGRLAARIARVFGVSRFAPALRLPPSIESLKEAVGAAVAGLPPRTFGVVCRRVNKRLPFTSADVARQVGAHIQALTGWPVHLDDPQLEVLIFLVDQFAYLGFGRLAGPGGLPTGSTGKVVSLISGGIDSPVATYRILKRGAEVVFVHFHSFPHTDAASQEKVREIGRLLLPPGHRARLYRVPFAELQERIVTGTPQQYRVVLYRRFMVRAAEAIARREGALALVTGESLGQVASQTLENLHTIGSAAALPILRPLIGTHKVEIVEEARRIGTFETSIEPHEDCCSFLMPRHPVTRSTPAELESIEQVFDIPLETEKLLQASTAEDLVGGEPSK
jgi:thiamine biosynthesis protein ThiI